VKLSVRAVRDAYLSVIAIGPSGNATQLYPNAVQPSQLVQAGTVFEIPGADAAAAIVASGSPGKELIRVVASTSPLPVIDQKNLTGEGAFQTISGGAATVARDLRIALGTAQSDIAIYDKVITTTPAGSAEVHLELTAPAPEQPALQAPLLAFDNSAYKIGDTIKLAVTSLDGCYLWVVNVSSDKSVRVLFPNKLVRDNKISPNSTVVVSGGNSPVKIMAAGPAGREAVFGLCSREATSPWLAGIDFSTMFPNLDASEGLGKALVAAAADSQQPSGVPEGISLSREILTVTE
jgi:hypothetical protein